MAKKLVKKAATAVVEPEEDIAYPEKSPTGAALVFVDNQGVAHYEDGSRFAVDDDEEPDSPEEEEELPEDEDEDEESDDEDEDEAAEVEDESEVEEDDESDDEDVEKNAHPAAAMTAKKKGGFKGIKKPKNADYEDRQGFIAKALSDPTMVGLDALRLSTALVEQMQEIFSTTELSKREQAYENAMLQFNRVMDTAATENWLVGDSVSKRDNTEAVDEAVEAISKTYTTVIENAGGTPVSKKDETVDIYKGLTPEAAQIVKRSAEVLEEREVEKWQAVAKGFKNVPGDKDALGAALRVLHDSDPEKYEVVRTALGAADEGLKDSEVFKSFGVAGSDTPTNVKARAQELVSKGVAKTLDEAELALIEQNPGEFYTPTNA